MSNIVAASFCTEEPSYLEIVLPQVVKRQALCSSFPLVVAAPFSNAIDIAPVLLLLRVL